MSEAVGCTLPHVLWALQVTEDYFADLGFGLFWTLIFAIDIALNFNTAYLEGMRYVEDFRRIWTRYLRRYLVIDLAATIPFDLLCYLLREVGVLGPPPSTAFEILYMISAHLRLLRY